MKETNDAECRVGIKRQQQQLLLLRNDLEEEKIEESSAVSNINVSDSGISETKSKESEERATDPAYLPFPWVAVLALDVGMLAHVIGFTVPMPYVAFMVVDFKMSDSLDTAGYFAGYILAAMMVGRVFSGIPWGLAADKWGRVICLTVSMLDVTVFGLLFGLSQNFWQAVLFRFFLGVGNGYMGIAKASITEVCATKEHQLRAFGTLNGVFGLGLVVGPAVGGLLARPCVLYPETFSCSSVWGTFPYLMPAVVCASVSVVAAITIYFFVPETLAAASSSSSSPSPSFKGVRFEKLSDKSTHEILSNNAFVDEYAEAESDDAGDIEMNTLSPIPSSAERTDNAGSSADELDSSSATDIAKSQGNDYDDDDDGNNSTKLLPATMSEVLHSYRIRVLMFIYFLFLFLILASDEAFPLWAVTTMAHGGFAWSSSQVGTTLSLSGAFLIIYQLFFFEKAMTTLFSNQAVTQFSQLTALGGLSVIALPITAAISIQFVTSTFSWSFMGIIAIPILFKQVFVASALTGIGLMINDSVDSKMRGTLNGLVMVAGSIGQALGPIVGSTLYALFTMDAHEGDSDDSDSSTNNSSNGNRSTIPNNVNSQTIREQSEEHGVSSELLHSVGSGIGSFADGKLLFVITGTLMVLLAMVSRRYMKW